MLKCSYSVIDYLTLLVIHILPGNRETHDRRKHSPPLVKLFENGMSKWTGAIFGILDLLSLPEDKTFTQSKGDSFRKVFF